MTLDLWTNHYTHVSFLAITCHFINENEQENKLQLNNYVLKNAEINEKTGDKIRGVLIEVLHEMKCYRIDNVYVTDNGKNVQRAVDIFNHISCAGHNLNLVLKHSFEANPKLEMIIETIESINGSFKKYQF